MCWCDDRFLSSIDEIMSRHIPKELIRNNWIRGLKYHTFGLGLDEVGVLFMKLLARKNSRHSKIYDPST